MTVTPLSPSTSPILQEIVRQMRAADPYGTYRTWRDELLLKPFVVTKAQKRQISLEGEVDPAVRSRILIYYRAIAALIEKETGLLAQVVLDLNSEGFGWVLVFSGRLLLVVNTLRDAHRFGFESLEQLTEKATALIDKGIQLARTYPEVGRL
ncbi:MULTISPECIES: NifX-associated nitrogen fixation protein [unclassified Synechococcus]|jgi:probable nitrogen fixation protein|uniref:NifX-associated nitrogen fixation protein n=1 Tax=unclassified Synechococcus TaxID=2626047 RepID=UPI0039C37400